MCFQLDDSKVSHEGTHLGLGLLFCGEEKWGCVGGHMAAPDTSLYRAQQANPNPNPNPNLDAGARFQIGLGLGLGLAIVGRVDSNTLRRVYPTITLGTVLVQALRGHAVYLRGSGSWRVLGVSFAGVRVSAPWEDYHTQRQPPQITSLPQCKDRQRWEEWAWPCPFPSV